MVAILVGCDLALVVTIVGGAHLLRQTAFGGVPRGNLACGRHLSQPETTPARVFAGLASMFSLGRIRERDVVARGHGDGDLVVWFTRERGFPCVVRPCESSGHNMNLR